MDPKKHTHRCAAFRSLHESGCFVIPNPWDRGSAIFLEHAGFLALASSSAGFAFTRGLPDRVTSLPRDDVLAHLADIAAATALPVNADFQSGYGEDAKSVAQSVALAVETGIAGLSIEDATGDPARPLYELEEAVDRLRAAREAIDAAGGHVVLTARSEGYLVGHPDPLEESIRRLSAFAEAGADVLFAPGVHDKDAIRAIVDAAGPKPVNVLVSANVGLRVSDLAELGVRRVSVGSALARVAWGAFMRAARGLAEMGTFDGFDGLAPITELNVLFARRSA